MLHTCKDWQPQLSTVHDVLSCEVGTCPTSPEESMPGIHLAAMTTVMGHGLTEPCSLTMSSITPCHVPVALCCELVLWHHAVDSCCAIVLCSRALQSCCAIVLCNCVVGLCY